MYLRYAERHRFTPEVLSLNETGIGGHQGGDRPDPRRRRLQPPQVRGRRPPRPAHPGDRVVGPHPHLDRDGRRPARGRRGRDRDRRGAATSGSTSSARRGRAASRSTRPTRRSASPTCRPASSSRSRTRRASTRTRPRRCRCCARGCYDLEQPEAARGRFRGPAVDGRRRATGRTRSGPTTSRRTGSPTTGSGKTVHNLPRVMDGDLDDLIDALIMADQADRLARTSAEPTMARRDPSRESPRRRPTIRADERLDRAGLGRPLRSSRASGPIAEGHRPRHRPGPQARQPVPADRPVRRHPPRLARAGPVPQRHAAALVLRAARRRRAAGRCSRARSARNYRGVDPADEPDARPQPGRQGPARPTARRPDDRDHPRPADRRRRPARSGSRSSTTPSDAEHGRRSSSSSAPTRPTSSRSAAIPRPTAARCCRSPLTDERATFRYDGLDGRRSSTHVAFSEPGDARRPCGRTTAGTCGGAVRFRWTLAARAGRRRTSSSWTSGPATSRRRGERARRRGRPPGGRRRGRRSSPSAPRIAAGRGAGGLPRLGRGARPPSPPTTSCSTSRSAARVADLRLLVNDGPGRGRALHRRRRAVVHDAVRAGLAHHGAPDARRSGPSRRRDARRPGAPPGDRGRRLARRRAGQDPPRAADRRDGPGRRAAAHAVLRQRSIRRRSG